MPAAGGDPRIDEAIVTARRARDEAREALRAAEEIAVLLHKHEKDEDKETA